MSKAFDLWVWLAELLITSINSTLVGRFLAWPHVVKFTCFDWTSRIHYLLHEFLTFNTVGSVSAFDILLHAAETAQLILNAIADYKILGEIHRLELCWHLLLLLLNIKTRCRSCYFILSLFFCWVIISFLLFWRLLLSSFRSVLFFFLFISTGVYLIHLSQLCQYFLLLHDVFHLSLLFGVCLALAHTLHLLH